MTDVEKRIKILTVLFGMFGQAGDDNRIDLYLQFTQDLPTEVLDKAVKKVVTECKFLPTVAEIIEAARGLVAEAEPETRVKTWAEAWGEIERAMYRTPWGRTPTFSTPEIAEAVFSFGWTTLHQALASEMPTIRAQIRRIYEDVCARRKEKANNSYALSGDKNALLRGKRGGGLTKIGIKDKDKLKTGGGEAC